MDNAIKSHALSLLSAKADGVAKSIRHFRRVDDCVNRRWGEECGDFCGTDRTFASALFVAANRGKFS
jgi:hypothetical protein